MNFVKKEMVIWQNFEGAMGAQQKEEAAKHSFFFRIEWSIE